MNNRKLRLAIGLVISLAAVSAVAQEASTGQTATFEEIVVTAQKREQSVQAVPIALSAFNAEAIRQLGARDFTGLTAMTTGFSVAGGNPAFPSPYIRGIGSNATDVGSDPSIGIYVDGVYAARKGGSLSDLLDVERVEILKGPQGTLFGRNSIGGAISVITAKPTSQFEGMVAAEAGNYGNRGVKGTVNIPLAGDTLLLRASAMTRQRDGWQKNTLGGPKGGSRDRDAAQLKIEWLPGEGVDITLSNYWSRADETSFYSENLSSGLGLPVDPLAKVLDDTKAVNGNLNMFGITDDNLAPTVPYYRRTMHAHALNIDWELSDSLTFTSLTAYRSYKTSAASDYDGSEYLVASNQNSTEENDTISQEFRLTGSSDRLDWFVGVSGMQEKPEMQFAVLLFDFLNANGRRSFVDDSLVSAKTESYAVYGDLTWHATDRLNLTVGGRYSSDDKSIRYNKLASQAEGAAGLGGLGFIMPVQGQFVGADGLPDPDATRGSDTWTDFSPRVVVDYALMDDVMLYASATRGYKSGGFNTYPSVVQVPGPNFLKVLPAATEPVDPETTLNYEVGMKSAWFDRNLTFNLSAFYIDYEDLQVTVISGQTVQLANAGAATSKGVELEARIHATPDLVFILGGAYTDAQYDKFVSAGVDYAGTPLRYAPEWAGNIAVDYTKELGIGTIKAFANYAMKSEYNLFETYTQDGYGLLNARLSWTSTNGDWELAVFGDNLTDEAYIVNFVNQTNSFGFTSGSRNDPRTYGAQLTYRF